MKIIYIPIWFYLYQHHLSQPSESYTKFTFQYGSTYIKENAQQKLDYLKFTFQYGSTYIHKKNINLILTYKFTFQYGSTYIYLILPAHFEISYLHSNMVLLIFYILM